MTKLKDKISLFHQGGKAAVDICRENWDSAITGTPLNFLFEKSLPWALYSPFAYISTGFHMLKLQEEGKIEKLNNEFYVTE